MCDLWSQTVYHDSDVLLITLTMFTNTHAARDRYAGWSCATLFFSPSVSFRRIFRRAWVLASNPLLYVCSFVTVSIASKHHSMLDSNKITTTTAKYIVLNAASRSIVRCESALVPSCIYALQLINLRIVVCFFLGFFIGLWCVWLREMCIATQMRYARKHTHNIHSCFVLLASL